MFLVGLDKLIHNMKIDNADALYSVENFKKLPAER
jgi:hypothetical protein